MREPQRGGVFYIRRHFARRHIQEELYPFSDLTSKHSNMKGHERPPVPRSGAQEHPKFLGTLRMPTRFDLEGPKSLW